MKSKLVKGAFYGTLAGVIDLVPMLIQGLTWDANLSAFSMWVVIGILLSITQLKLNSAIRGVLISFLVLLPNAFLIGWSQPISLVPIAVMTLLLGSGLGYALNKSN
jgi:uncharacterized membrane protein YjjP (DUF1212 family)